MFYYKCDKEAQTLSVYDLHQQFSSF